MSIYINSENSLKNIINLYIGNQYIFKGYIGIDNLSKVFYYKRRRIIPEEYTKLKYLQTTYYNNSYIDTKVIANSNTGIKITFSMNKESFEPDTTVGHSPDSYVHPIFGYSSTSYSVTNKDWCIFCNHPAQDHFLAHYKVGSHRYEQYLYSDAPYNTPITIFFNYKDDTKYYHSERKYFREVIHSDFRNVLNDTLLIGAYRNYNNEKIEKSSVGFKLYHFIITQGNQIIRNFCPVRRNSDGIIGLYDIIENKFYPNLGTDDFIGSDENGEEDTCPTVICDFEEPFYCPTNITCPKNLGCPTEVDCLTHCTAESYEDCPYVCDFCFDKECWTLVCPVLGCTSYCDTMGQGCSAQWIGCSNEGCTSENTIPTQVYAPSLYGGGAQGWSLFTNDNNVYTSIDSGVFVSGGWYDIQGYYEGNPVVKIGNQSVVLEYYNWAGCSDDCPNLRPWP